MRIMRWKEEEVVKDCEAKEEEEKVGRGGEETMEPGE